MSDTDAHLVRKVALEWHRTGDFPHVVIDERDSLPSIDWRFVIGLTVHLDAWRDSERAKTLFSAIRSAKPKTLVCAVDNEIWFYSEEEGGNGKRIRA